MDRQKYEMLVWSMQGEAQDSPGPFGFKVLLISLCAYLILFGLLAALLTGLFLVFSMAQERLFFKVLFVSWVIVVVPIVWLTLRMFFVSIPPPQGRKLEESDAPRLFGMISDVRSRLRGAPIYQVLITDEFNASISQCPRFGLFGGYRNYLVLGLPLLYALSEDEFRAVVAHEYGHIAGGHGKMSRWIYRQRSTFDVLYEHAQERRESNLPNGLIAVLLDWFAPYYNAYTFVLSRQDEYEADAVSRKMAGASMAASALTRIRLLSTWLHGDFWPKLYDQAKQHATPQIMPFSAMRKLFAVTMDEWATKERLLGIWKADSDVYDTHPCLRERLEAMEQRAVMPGAVTTSAADAMLGKLTLTLARELDEGWWAAEKSKWQNYHKRYTRSSDRISELEQKPVATLSAPEAQELALLLVEFRTMGAAKLVLEELIGRPGERYPKPIYYYGRVLLEEGDIRGLEYLEEVCRLSPAMGDDCARAGYQWLCTKRDETEAERWLERLSAATA